MNSTIMEHITSCNICESNNIEPLDKSRNFWKCTNCGYIFDNPRPTQTEIKNFYSKPSQYDDWLLHEKQRNDLWKRRITKIGEHEKPGSLLDIGTGIGQFLYLIQQNYSEVLGIEISKSAISIAKEKYNLDVLEGDIYNAAIPSGINFDIITIFHVLEHVPDPKQVIDRCYSLLCQGGKLIVAVPNDVNSLRLSGKALIKRILGRCGFGAYKNAGKLGIPRLTLDGSMSEIHFSHFTPDVLQQFLEDSGFEVIDNSLDPYFVASGLKNFLHKTYYLLMVILKTLLNKNYYETIWITGRKQ